MPTAKNRNIYTFLKLGIAVLLSIAINLPASAALIASWSGEGNANDSSGNGYNGSLVGNTSYGTGVSGQGFVFDGNNDYVSFNNVDFAQGSYSISGWFQVTNDTVNNTVFSATQFGGSSHGIMVRVESSGNLRFLHRFPYGSSGGTSLFTSGLSLNDGDFYHFAVVKNGASMSTFIDGVLSASTTDSSTFTSSMNIDLGINSRNSLVHDFNGTIDEVGVYNHALTLEEVALLAGASSTPVSAPSSILLAILGLVAMMLFRKYRF